VTDGAGGRQQGPSSLDGAPALFRFDPVLPPNYDYLYRLFTTGDTGWRYRFRGATPNPEVFPDLLWESVLSQKLVVRPVDGAIMGVVQLTDYNARSRTCSLSIVADPNFRRLGLVTTAAVLFVSDAFRTWDLRKIYLNVLEFNLHQIAGYTGLFTEEGRLRAHEWHDGSWWDLITFAIYRDRFDDLFRDLIHDGLHATIDIDVDVGTARLRSAD
jgi:RimJ/RimL family protein N-acetyltransferase